MVLIVTGGPTQRTIVPWPNPTPRSVSPTSVAMATSSGPDSSFLARLAGLGAAPSTDADNLAPYSFFNVMSGDPLHVVFAPGMGEGVRKDTLDNVREVPEFTVNIVTAETVHQMSDRCVNPGRRRRVRACAAQGKVALP